ncbi:MAG TPA: phage holin family protein [Pseudidiomarina sp.]|nr:phage holin family protein [Pseudidiomarina sp.]
MAVHKPTTADDSESLYQQVQTLASEVRGVFKTQLQLAGMEARRAGESLVRMVAFGIMAACLIFTAWALLVTATVVALVMSNTLSLLTALLLVALIHLAASFLLWRAIKQLSSNLLFSITSRNV